MLKEVQNSLSFCPQDPQQFSNEPGTNVVVETNRTRLRAKHVTSWVYLLVYCNYEHKRDACRQKFSQLLYVIVHRRKLHPFHRMLSGVIRYTWHIDRGRISGLWYSYVCHKFAAGPFKLS